MVFFGKLLEIIDKQSIAEAELLGFYVGIIRQ